MRSLGLVALALVAAASQAEAQSQRYPPIPRDIDETDEQRSPIWEKVLNPNRVRYEERTAHAWRLLSKRYSSSKEERLVLDEARALLESAVELDPYAPEAHWLIGVLSERREDWQRCAEAYAKVFAIAPDYRPTHLPPKRNAAWAVDFSVALCHAQKAAYERSIVHYKRILSRGITNHALVYRHLGEAYMALGRLREALSALTAAARLEPDNARINYALAVAYDRQGKPDHAQLHLRLARNLDRGSIHLDDPRDVFIPATDALYYLGLARAYDGATAAALVYFRHYLQVAGQGPWAYRARQHSEMLAEGAPTAQRIELTGTGSMDRLAVGKSLARVSDRLQACVRSLPGVLFRVRITARAGGARGRGRRAQERGSPRESRRASQTLGVKAEVLHAFGAERDAIAEAQQCLEGVAERISLPRIKGRSNYVSVRFPVIAH